MGHSDCLLVVGYSVWGRMQGRAGQGREGQVCAETSREDKTGQRIVALAVYIDRYRQTHSLHRLTRKKKNNTILSSKGIRVMAFRRPSIVQEF